MSRWGILAFGVVAYLAGVRSLLYFVGFSSHLIVSRTVDSGREGAWPAALAVDVALLSSFALLHSVMARRPVKLALTRRVPAAAERSVYVIVAAASLTLLMWQWRPIDAEVWNVAAPAGRYLLFGTALAGWLLAAIALFSIGHLELFGLRQARAFFRGHAPVAGGLVTTGVYRYLRDPVFLGYCVGLWSAPRMTVGHLVLAAGMSVYVVAGARYERRDLVARFGADYLGWVDTL